METLVCRDCGQEFEAKSKKRKLCDYCRDESKRLSSQKKCLKDQIKKIGDSCFCVVCGKLLPENRLKTCSNRCKFALIKAAYAKAYTKVWKRHEDAKKSAESA